QHGDLQQSQLQCDLSQPHGSDDRQLAVPAGRLRRSGATDAAQRRLRRRDQRAAAAEFAVAAPLPVLTLREHRGHEGHKEKTFFVSSVSFVFYAVSDAIGRPAPSGIGTPSHRAIVAQTSSRRAWAVPAAGAVAVSGPIASISSTPSARNR